MERKSEKHDQNNAEQSEKSSLVLKPSHLSDGSSTYKSVTTAEKVFAGAGGSRGVMCNNLTSNPFSVLATDESSSLNAPPSIVAKPRFNFKPSALGSGGFGAAALKPAATGYTGPKLGTSTAGLFGGSPSGIPNPFLKPAKLIHESDDSDKKTTGDKKENVTPETVPAESNAAEEPLAVKTTEKSDTSSTEKSNASESKPATSLTNTSLASSISTTIGQNTLTGTSAPTQSSSASFVFGEAVDARVTNVNTEVTTNGAANGKHAGEDKPKTLEEAADEYKKQQESGPRLPEVEVKTGEENESNVLQINCKLFLFHKADSSWIERGRGLLRLNDRLDNRSSRIIMRTAGTYQVILNTNIWFQMICDRASPKGLRITAMENDTVHVFLLTGSQSDIEHLYNSISYRISSLKQKNKQESSNTNQQEGDKSKTLKRTAPDQQQSTSAVKKTKTEGDSVETSS